MFSDPEALLFAEGKLQIFPSNLATQFCQALALPPATCHRVYFHGCWFSSSDETYATEQLLYNKQFKSDGRVTSNFFANHCILKWHDGLTNKGKVSPAFILVLVMSNFHLHIHKHCLFHRYILHFFFTVFFFPV